MSHDDEPVQRSLSSQAVPFSSLVYSQAPVAALQLSVWHVCFRQTFGVPAHAPALHLSTSVQALASSQAVPLATAVLLQAPVAGLQAAVLQIGAAGQTVGAPAMHAPLTQLSPAVQALPSLHRVPAGNGVSLQAPVAGSHAFVTQAPPGAQATGVPTQAPVPSQRSPSVQRSPSSQLTDGVALHAVRLSATHASQGLAGLVTPIATHTSSIEHPLHSVNSSVPRPERVAAKISCGLGPPAFRIAKSCGAAEAAPGAMSTRTVPASVESVNHRSLPPSACAEKKSFPSNTVRFSGNADRWLAPRFATIAASPAAPPLQ